MGYLMLGLIFMVIAIVVIAIPSKVDFNSSWTVFGFYFYAGFMILITILCLKAYLKLPTHETGTYTLIKNSSGNYITIDEDDMYEVITEEEGIPKIYTFNCSCADIFYIDSDEQPRLEIDESYFSFEYKVYIPKESAVEEAKQ